MYHSTVLTICFVIGQVVSQNIDPRIVGGTKASIAEFPYLVSIRIGDKHVCGGALLTSFTVITAAHCVDGVDKATLKVFAGVETNDATTGKNSGVDQIKINPRYSRNTLNYDMALLILTTSLTGPNIAPIKIYTQTLVSGILVKTAGWGVTKEGGPAQADLRKVNLKVQSRATCQSIFPSILGSSMFCAGWLTGGIAACDGDYGGPLVYNGLLVGITSIGSGCGRRDYTGLNIQVPMNRAWILANWKQ